MSHESRRRFGLAEFKKAVPGALVAAAVGLSAPKPAEAIMDTERYISATECTQVVESIVFDPEGQSFSAVTEIKTFNSHQGDRAQYKTTDAISEFSVTARLATAYYQSDYFTGYGLYAARVGFKEGMLNSANGTYVRDLPEEQLQYIFPESAGDCTESVVSVDIFKAPRMTYVDTPAGKTAPETIFNINETLGR